MTTTAREEKQKKEKLKKFLEELQNVDQKILEKQKTIRIKCNRKRLKENKYQKNNVAWKRRIIERRREATQIFKKL